jgi:hypothetical protein
MRNAGSTMEAPNHKETNIMNWTRTIGRLAVVATLGATILAGPISGSADAAARCNTRWGSLSKQTPNSYVEASFPVGGQQGHLTGVRSARHRCFDRLVLDIDGLGANDFHVSYVDEVTQDGSGYSVPVAGGAFLQIGVMAPSYDQSGTPTYQPVNWTELRNVAGYRTFRQVAFAGSFEGRTSLGLGVRARLPFRVFSLDGPGDGSRLVIDVAHRW